MVGQIGASVELEFSVNEPRILFEAAEQAYEMRKRRSSWKRDSHGMYWPKTAQDAAFVALAVDREDPWGDRNECGITLLDYGLPSDQLPQHDVGVYNPDAQKVVIEFDIMNRDNARRLVRDRAEVADLSDAELVAYLAFDLIDGWGRETSIVESIGLDVNGVKFGVEGDTELAEEAAAAFDDLTNDRYHVYTDSQRHSLSM